MIITSLLLFYGLRYLQLSINHLHPLQQSPYITHRWSTHTNPRLDRTGPDWTGPVTAWSLIKQWQNRSCPWLNRTCLWLVQDAPLMGTKMVLDLLKPIDWQLNHDYGSCTYPDHPNTVGDRRGPSRTLRRQVRHKLVVGREKFVCCVTRH